MKRLLLVILAISPFLLLEAQPKIKDKKYPSLLWEISGNGIKKPSYLIGTMHVSSKLAFHLPDSFYIALRTAQVVALETNPETWQEDMSNYDLGEENYSTGYRMRNYNSMPGDYMSINTLKFYKYDKKIERALYSSSSTINNLLYRTYGNKSSDFEEDTYLDMYIFQCGKKWGKKVTGVENYGESMRLMTEAYKDASKDRSKRERSYDGDDDYSMDKLQEAYRAGNLDLLDSINQYNSFSAAFDEKFLYRRNEIQAHSMDSIMRSGRSLFVGVGAAHLPGARGVIELLRRKGYKLRPVKMGERDSRDKEEVEKVRVPVTFHTETADDGLFKVDIPGKFYKVGEDESLAQKQYADMANGSYYMVTRTMTNAWMWGHNADNVYKTVDSLLYENIPGKIISRISITRNGYKGFDITNRTRRGDLQRYNIFITPFEIIFFKMSGNGDYVKNGDEANKFFGSIQFREYKSTAESATSWKKYSPPAGGFIVDFPHDPYIGNDGSWIFDSEDKTTGTQYRVVRSDIHNYHFVEEDSFDLGLMDESFMASDFIETQLSRKQTTFRGYPALDCKYRDKRGAVYLVRYIIQGPHYYALVAHGKKETAMMTNFLNSFQIKPFIYGDAKQRKDTSLYFTVNSPVFPENKKIQLGTPRRNSLFGDDDDDADESEWDLLEGGTYRNKTIANDTTGEKIYVSFLRMPGYFHVRDSAAFDRGAGRTLPDDSSFIVRLDKKTDGPGNIKIREMILTDTGSSRMLWSKNFYKNGIMFSLMTEGDTLSQPSPFIKKFFETFTPADTLKGINPFEKKSKLFFADLESSDSIRHKRAVRQIEEIDLDSSDLPRLSAAIARTNWSEKKYLDVKKSLIQKIGDMKSKPASEQLRRMYYALDDTIQLQYAVLESLLKQETVHAFRTFGDIVKSEPPVLVSNSSSFSPPILLDLRTHNDFSNDNFLDELDDSLELTHVILPDILPLINLEDYKGSIMQLLATMVDSNLVRPSEYETWYSKFLQEAKHELKKQSIAEKKKAIEKEEERKADKRPLYLPGPDEDKDDGNAGLGLYATLLLPFWDTHPEVQPLLQQMLKSSDKRLRYSTMLLLLRHNKPFPDSLLNYFAGLDDYRYELYHDLKKLDRQNRFPAKYNNHIDLTKSSLLNRKSSRPDSLVYLDKLPAEVKGRKGYIYFYKYKEKKDDLSWKLATAGLIPENPGLFEFDEKRLPEGFRPSYKFLALQSLFDKDFTGFTETRLEEDEPLSSQLSKELKKLLYSHRKSAREFYDNDNSRVDGNYNID